jgi:hypothetical protein
MRGFGGEKLVALGLQVRSLTGEQGLEAQRLRALERKISIHDSYALSLAKAEAAILLAGMWPCGGWRKLKVPIPRCSLGASSRWQRKRRARL